MRPMSLEQIAEITDGRLSRSEGAAKLIRDVTFDSRAVKGDELFFALRGERDGHDFAANAIENGAAAVVVSREIAGDFPQIIVDDTLNALGNLAKEYRRSIDATINCVTGSLGKTTSRRAIAQVLSARFDVVESKQNFNNLIGLPISILQIEPEHEMAALELGINLPGEMARLAEIAQPDNALIMNIAPVHLEGLRDLETITSEKLEVLNHVRPGGKAFLNIDDERLLQQRILPDDRVIFFGYDADADYRINEVSSDGNFGTVVTVEGTSIRTKLYGRGAAYAVCCAFALASELGLSPVEIADALENFEGLPDRLYVRKVGEITLISDVYNSSPVAVSSALETLATMDSSRKIAVLGDMLELGEREIEFHEQMGTRAASMGVDKLFLFGELSEAAVKGALKRGMKATDIFITDDYPEIERVVIEAIEPGDAVLVKGSRAMLLERLVERILEKYEN